MKRRERGEDERRGVKKGEKSGMRERTRDERKVRVGRKRKWEGRMTERGEKREREEKEKVRRG